MTELVDPDPEALPQKPVSREGDLWLLGDHRLICGDSRNPAVLDRLLEGEQADLVWTDPPYGVSYEGKTADALTIQNDGVEGLRKLLQAVLGNAAQRCRPGTVWYVAAPAGPQFAEFGHVLSDLGVWRQTLVWVKDVFVLGHSDFITAMRCCSTAGLLVHNTAAPTSAPTTRCGSTLASSQRGPSNREAGRARCARPQAQQRSRRPGS